jgi:hypothetical protein
MYRYKLYHVELKKPVTLVYEPVGWDSLNKSLSRDRKYHGIFTKYTPKLKFIKDGRAIIHNLWDAHGPETEILIFIEIFNMITRKWEQDYTGRLNLYSTVVSKLYLECNIENTGFVQKFLNRDEINVNLQSLVNMDGGVIPAFTHETWSVPVKSKVIIQEIKCDASFATTGQRNTDGVDLDDGTYFIQFPLEPLLVNEIDALETYDYGPQYSKIDPVSIRKFQRRVRYGGVHRFNLNFTYIVGTNFTGSDNDFSVEWYITTGRPGSYTHTQIGTTDATTGQASLLGDKLADFSVTLAAGDEIYMYGKLVIDVDPAVNVGFFLQIDLQYIEIFAETIFPDSNANMVLLHEAFTRTLQSIIGQNDVFRSPYYGRTDSEPVTYDADGAGSLRGILNGSQVRQFPLDERPIHTNFKELFETAQMLDGVGAGIEVIDGKEMVVVDDLTRFYNGVEVARFDYVRDITKEVAADYYYNEMEIGFKKWANNEVQNLDEFLTKKQYSFPLSMVKQKLSLIAPYIASGYTLEFTRREAYVKSTLKDNPNDNENFVLQLRRGGGSFTTDQAEDFDTLGNLIRPDTVLNAKLSIVRCILRNGRLIRSFLDEYPDKVIKLTFSEGNGKLVSKLTTETNGVDESLDIAITSLARPLWKPQIYRFKVPITSAQFSAISLNPYGYVSFSETARGHKKAFILEAERDAKTKKLMNFVGLKANI